MADLPSPREGHGLTDHGLSVRGGVKERERGVRAPKPARASRHVELGGG